MQDVRICGPILSVKHLSDHQHFFGETFAMQSTAKGQLCPTQTGHLLGVDGCAMETVFYQRVPTDFGVRLWQIDPPHDETVREPERGTDLDALKVIDFYAAEFDDSIDALNTAGYRPKDSIARYTLPEGEFCEAHFWRPDNVVCAVISGPADFFANFVTARDRQFSEPQSISAPVSDVSAVVDFYEHVFGFTELYRYQIANPSFDAMVGTDEPINLSAINIGTDLRAPYLGVIDYGQTASRGASLAGRSRPPMRGLVGVEFAVESVDNIVNAATRWNASIIAGPSVLTYPPYGPVISCLIEGPHGVIHHVLQKSSA